MKILTALPLSFALALLGCNAAPAPEWVTEGCRVERYNELIKDIPADATQEEIAAQSPEEPVNAGDNITIVPIANQGVPVAALVKLVDGYSNEMTLMVEGQAPCQFTVANPE